MTCDHVAITASLELALGAASVLYSLTYAGNLPMPPVEIANSTDIGSIYGAIWLSLYRMAVEGIDQAASRHVI